MHPHTYKFCLLSCLCLLCRTTSSDTVTNGNYNCASKQGEWPKQRRLESRFVSVERLFPPTVELSRVALQSDLSAVFAVRFIYCMCNSSGHLGLGLDRESVTAVSVSEGGYCYRSFTC